MDALQFLAENKPLRSVRPIYVLAGGDRYLKRLVLERLLGRLAGEDASDWSRSFYTGESENLAEVFSELQTPALWGPRRVIVVDDADGFVSRFRESLEKLAGGSATAVLVLLVDKWASNTRLARALPGDAVIVCDPPKPRQLVPWFVARAENVHGKKISSDAAELLVELTGGDLGLLEQELAKLAVYVGSRDTITAQDVDDLVARNRVQTVWDILEAAGAGESYRALTILNQLLDRGQEPLAILAALSWQLRKVAQIARLLRQGWTEQQALPRVGLQPWQRERVLVLLRRLGRRALRLYDWLLQADSQLKSTNLPPRLVLETLLVRLLPDSSEVSQPTTARA